MDIFAEIAKTASRKHGEPIPDWEYWVIVGIIITLVLLGGIVAGLTIGLMSIDTTNLSILKASGTAQEKKYAARIEPIRKNTHLLLVTLLLVNTVVNETLPILFDAIHYTGWKAVLSSTVLIVVFGEILPQAICSRHGLRIGAFFAWPVRILIWFMWLISYPIAKLLDWLLGHKGGIVYRHAGLKELVTLHGEDQSGPLSSDEVSILRAVLDLRTKTVKDVMTSLEDVYMLEVSKKLDRKTVASIVQAGHSRVPIYIGDRQHILGALLVKQLIVYAPDDEMPLSAIKLRKLPRVRSDTPLFEMMHIFEAGQSHMALIVEETNIQSRASLVGDVFVTSSPNWSLRNPSTEATRHSIIGIITLEDVIEELIGEEIVDETDVYVDISKKTPVTRTWPSALSINTTSVNDAEAVALEIVVEESTPLLHGKKVNPNSAIPYRQITLPSSNSFHRQRKPSEKRKRKEFFPASQLATDMFADNRVKNLEIPEIRLSDPEMDLSKSV